MWHNYFGFDLFLFVQHLAYLRSNPLLISLFLDTEDKYIHHFFMNHVLVTNTPWAAPCCTFWAPSHNEVAEIEHCFLMTLVACHWIISAALCPAARAVFQKLVCSFSSLLLLAGKSANGLLHYPLLLLGSLLSKNSMLCSYLDCNLYAYSSSNWLHYFTLCCTEFYEPLIHPKADMLVINIKFLLIPSNAAITCV